MFSRLKSPLGGGAHGRQLQTARSVEEGKRDELFGLINQMRRAAVSVPSNIAEGQARHSRKDFVRFFRQSKGSVAELQTQTIIAVRRGGI